MDCRMPGFPVLHYFREFDQTRDDWVDEAIQPSHPLLPLLLLPSISPSIKIFSNKWALPIRWPKYWRFSCSIRPSNENSGLIFFGIDWFNLLQCKGLSRVFSSITIQKQQLFNTQPSSWSNSYIRTWLLGKPYLWLYGPLSEKWYLCFLICCLGLSWASGWLVYACVLSHLSCLTLCNPMDCSPPGSSVHGILWA